MSVGRRLSKKERDELESLLEARDPGFTGPMQASATRLHGFLTSVVSGPMILPSEWMPMAFGSGDDGGWETVKQAKRATNLLMRFYNEIISDLAGEGRRRYAILVNRIGDAPDTMDLADDWCKGYIAGIALRERMGSRHGRSRDP